MKPKINLMQGEKVRNTSSHEILILTDGRILTHNLTPGMAVVLRKLNPDDKPMRKRARNPEHRLSHELRK